MALDQAGQTYAVWLGTDGTHWIVEGFLPDPPPGPGPPIGPPPVSGCTPHPGLPPCPPQTLARIPPGGGTPSLSALRVSPSTFATAGRVVAGHCVGVTRANQRRRRRCTRLLALHGRITRYGHAGLNRFRVTHAPLAPGAYRLTATPSANGHAGQPVNASFRIVP